MARDLDNLLAPGRHMACDPQTQAFMREIPQCWLTGHAAGVAAALASASGVPVADVDLSALQAELRRQGAYLQLADSTGAIAGGPPRGPNVSITADTPGVVSARDDDLDRRLGAEHLTTSASGSLSGTASG